MTTRLRNHHEFQAAGVGVWRPPLSPGGDGGSRRPFARASGIPTLPAARSAILTRDAMMPSPRSRRVSFARTPSEEKLVVIGEHVRGMALLTVFWPLLLPYWLARSGERLAAPWIGAALGLVQASAGSGPAVAGCPPPAATRPPPVVCWPLSRPPNLAPISRIQSETSFRACSTRSPRWRTCCSAAAAFAGCCGAQARGARVQRARMRREGGVPHACLPACVAAVCCPPTIPACCAHRQGPTACTATPRCQSLGRRPCWTPTSVRSRTGGCVGQGKRAVSEVCSEREGERVLASGSAIRAVALPCRPAGQPAIAGSPAPPSQHSRRHTSLRSSSSHLPPLPASPPSIPSPPPLPSLPPHPTERMASDLLHAAIAAAVAAVAPATEPAVPQPVTPPVVAAAAPSGPQSPLASAPPAGPKPLSEAAGAGLPPGGGAAAEAGGVGDGGVGPPQAEPEEVWRCGACVADA